MSTLKVAAINNPSASSGGLAISASGNVTGAGLDLITTQSFSAVSSVSINNCFTATYENYRVLVNLTGSSTNLVLLARTRLAGTDDTGTNYWAPEVYIGTTGGAFGSSVNAAATGWQIFSATDSTDTSNYAALDIWSPLGGKRKTAAGLFTQRNPSAVGYGYLRFFNKTVTTDYDGFTLYTSTGTVTGTLRVYGYRN